MPTNLGQARQELEQLVAIESAAEDREERIRRFLRHLVDDFGFEPQDLARRLRISRRSVDSLLSSDAAKPVEERLEISEDSVRALLDAE